MIELKEQFFLLGRKIEYKQDYVFEVLEVFDNKYFENDYWVCFNCLEFISLCFIIGQLDFVEICISYLFDVKMVESKSFKFYLFSFCNYGVFYEDCVNIIMKDLICLMDFKYIEVIGIFIFCGGILIYLYVNYGCLGMKYEEMVIYWLMNYEQGMILFMVIGFVVQYGYGFVYLFYKDQVDYLV